MVTHLTSYKQWVLLLLTALFLQVIYASEGCGGTVSVAPELSKLSKEKVDFTKVTVKLVSRDGILKYSSECAPTGHFFVPTYDKGNFFLEIEGPTGWNFEPSRVPVAISEDSPCDHNINFKFTGFSLKGKVISAGSSNKVGPKGVTLTLFVEGTKATTAVSDETGAYSFDNVYPGHYEISASHPRWKISPERIKTHMEWNNLEVDTPFVVAGYAVTGSVVSEDKKAISGVDVFLVSESASSLSCSPSSVPASIKSKGKSFCVAKSGANGEFEFASVPVGDYSLMPHYSSEQTTFHLAPESSTLKVTNGDVIVDAPFTVVGFDVSGRVVAGESGIEGAKVLVNGAEKTVTAKDGSYKLEKFKTGVYDITAVKADYEFSVLKGVKVSSNQPKLSNIQSTEVSVCGTLSIANPPPNVKVGLRDVQITANNNNNFRQKTVQADKDGKYCVSLPAGSYTVTPIVSSAEERSGLNFSPSQATITVASTPLRDISFSQLRVTVSGRVTCIPSSSSSSCDTGVSVSLVPTASSSSASPATAGLGLDNQFTFRDVLPGTYRLSVDIPSDVWCWDEQVKTVTISKDSSDFEFVQTGFVLPVTSSHDTDLIVNRVGGKKGEEEVHKVKAGEAGKVCLKKTGSYNVVPKSCFKFGNQDSFSFDTTAPTPLNLQASHMLVKGSVAADNVPAVDVAVYDSQNNKVATLNAKAEKGSHAIHFEHWATPGSSLKFSPSTPLNASLLPHPPSREFSVPSSSPSCLSPLAPFELKKGNFLAGKVIPGIAGVRISVKNPAGDELAHVMTSSDGSYSVGPLYDGEQHTVKAEKSDFHFQSDASGLVFRAAKLGRVRINAVDETTNEAVSGVLLSLSGEGYHNNTAIPAGSGALVFSDLFPGSYFVRAHLKEYSFTPAHASVNVVEGEEATHTFKVKRVAFSCFGSVKGLNSFPERGVVVLAQPVNTPSASVEETQTDSTGSFRLRGLQPTVTYSIFVKNSLSSSVSADNLRSSSSGDLAIPEAVQITIAKQDTHNVDFVVIRKPAYIDIVGTVNASTEYLSSLSVSLFDSRTSLDTPVKTIPLGISRAFIFTDIPAKSDSEYIVRLTTTLSARSYHVSISPDVTVQPRQVAGPRSLPLSFSFDASLKKDETEVPVSGLSSFVLLLVVPFLLFKYQERVLPIATRVYYLIRQYRTGVPAPKVAVRPKKATSTSQSEFDFLPAHLKAKQKTKTK